MKVIQPFISVQDNLVFTLALMDPKRFIETLLEFIGALEYWSNGC